MYVCFLKFEFSVITEILIISSNETLCLKLFGSFPDVFATKALIGYNLYNIVDVIKDFVLSLLLLLRLKNHLIITNFLDLAVEFFNLRWTLLFSKTIS